MRQQERPARLADLDVVDDIGNLFQRNINRRHADVLFLFVINRGCVGHHKHLGGRVEIRRREEELALAGLFAAGVPLLVQVRAALLHIVKVDFQLAVLAERERADELLVRAVGKRLEPKAAAIGEALAVKLIHDVLAQVLFALFLVVEAGVVGHVAAGNLHLVQHLVNLSAARFQRLLHAARRELGDVAIAAVGRHRRDDREAEQDSRQQDQAHLELHTAEPLRYR